MGTQPDLAGKLAKGDRRALARAISLVENETEGFEALLTQLSIPEKVPVIGFTGPPGAGKSTLINSLIHFWTQKDKEVAIVAVDPTSPFNYGSLLGDRIRMNDHYNNPNVFIRSLATRGSLGGISAKAIETVDLMKAAGFDYVLVETVGVGQSEVEIAGLADTTLVVTVPEGGDDVQVIKSGLMEIADVFVVNKADRPNSKRFINYLKQLVHERSTSDWEIPVVPTTASKSDGMEDLENAVQQHWEHVLLNQKKPHLLTEKAYRLIQNDRMKDIHRDALLTAIQEAVQQPDFNLYQFVKDYQASLVKD